MLKLFRKSGLSVRDLVAAGSAFLLVLVLMTSALSLAWYPANIGTYIFVAVLTAVVWPVSRVLPLATLVVVAVIVVVPLFWGYSDLEIRIIPLAVAGFRAAASGTRAYLVLPVTVVAALVALLPEFPRMLTVGEINNRVIVEWISDPSRRVLIALMLMVVLALGFAINRMRVVASDLALRNEQLLVLQASERERVSTEVRTAIARDIHDVVAHHVAAMVVRAQAADSVADREPERLREVVQAIAAEGNDALTAMRRAVQMMRAEGRDEPAAFDASVDVLVGRLRNGNRRVSVVGALSDADDAVRPTMLSILQEALTNVLLHSDSPQVDVRFAASPGFARMTVEDDGPGRDGSGLSNGGHGIRGMRERADAAGGSVVAGPRIGGGWSVRVVLPVSSGRDA